MWQRAQQASTPSSTRSPAVSSAQTAYLRLAKVSRLRIIRAWVEPV